MAVDPNNQQQKIKKFLNLVDLQALIERETRHHVALDPNQNIKA